MPGVLAHVVVAALGIWMMIAPAAFGYTQQPMEFNDRIVGTLVATFAIIAWWECTRSLRYANVVLGIYLALSALLIFDYPNGATINAVVVGLAMAGLSLIKGKVKGTYGGGWTTLWKKDPYGLKGKKPGERSD